MFSKILGRIKRAEAKPEGAPGEMPFSVVLLFRKFVYLPNADLQAAAERGWERRFDGQEDPLFAVTGKPGMQFVKAGPHVIALLEGNKGYLGAQKEMAKQLRSEQQARAWRQHRGWLALDLWNLELPKAEAYSTLARLALPLLAIPKMSKSCVGVYLPREGVFALNDGAAVEGLSLMLRQEFAG
ncbi:hypothetical protein [Silvibacterium dinghuense]|uniref:Uncharacterized protein n=1 Tax=Silvibacterium dinghuense TaxID=1560006 RepID=A0A4V1NVU6_9BACT|nr:hypothetical protein [Silvibacterium dinghuense]RXS97152.1 hypothetical protein ESZ00_04340 [Silvibacterium dinghuense]GGG96643.1 hypothetical protein GCM10011586_09800 [Silvibacterium dinghuense]